MRKIYVSGCHGVGKTTVIHKIAQRLERSGFSVYVFPEMSYRPNIKIGTIDFQLWFLKQIQFREKLMENIDNTYDFIIFDRAELDVHVYTSRLMTLTEDGSADREGMAKVFNEILKKNGYDGHNNASERSVHVILTLEPDVLIERLAERDKVEDWRAEWSEKDINYIDDITYMFEHTKTTAYTIPNTDIENTIEFILGVSY